VTKNKIFIYNHSKGHAHDKDPVYVNTIPFSKKGVENHFETTENPNDADFFYMGQFSEGKFNAFDSYEFINQYPNKHVCDIEGDWLGVDLTDTDISRSLFTINGLKDRYKKNANRMFVRPTFSKNLMKLLTKKTNEHINYNRKVTFIGFNDPFNIRLNLKHGLENKYPLKTDIVITDRWLGSSDDAFHHDRFNNQIISGTFSLCPRGAGVDSVRFLESCFHGRIPIVVSDNLCFGHDFPKRFYFQHSLKQSYDSFFEDIMSISDDQITEYSNNARDFFNTYVRSYFRDPTEFFLEWYYRTWT